MMEAMAMMGGGFRGLREGKSIDRIERVHPRLALPPQPFIRESHGNLLGKIFAISHHEIAIGVKAET
jgi:hypothetical protein